ncbi:MAG: SDR family NAD(P)-dependent oxidoreductase [Mycobacteriaceae bacterium]|nr:SDR family NAD(P)-dependent oxidoreductase [Mycobacteriaceae bacterium]MBV9638686.1 SDR family NAD(P)-dependent oxidoreductase [Mycobacteriaceae bacterium]
MTRRTIVITGASDGIGAAAARRLRRQGAHVVVVGRSADKTSAIAAELAADSFVADFAELAQVRGLAQCLRSAYPRIDVLANNAGGMTSNRQLTADGFEKTYQVNYLAPFLLTTQLLDLLVDSGATVINTSSAMHRLLRKVGIEDLQPTRSYSPSKAYALSKLAVILFSTELHRRYHHQGVSAVAFHPGYVNSNFGPASGSRFLRVMKRTPAALVIPGADRGADQLVWLASSRAGIDWRSGGYYSRHRIAKPNPRAADPALARELWERSLATTSS